MKFKQKMFLILFILPSLITVLVGFGILNNAETSLMESLFNQRYITLQQKSTYASQRLVEADQFIDEITRNGTVQLALKQNNPADSSQKKAIIRPLLSQKNFIEAFIITESGLR